MAIRQKGRVWQVDVTVGGVRAPRVSAATKFEAERLDAQFKADMLAGRTPSAGPPPVRPPGPPPGPLSMPSLDTAYRDKWRGSKAEVSSRMNGRLWVDALGADFDVRDLNPAVVADVVDSWAAAGLAPATINRQARRPLSNAQRGREARARHCPLRARPEEGIRRAPALYDNEEVADWLEFAGDDPEFKWLLHVALDTGAGHGELMNLRVRDCKLTGVVPANPSECTGDSPSVTFGSPRATERGPYR